VAADMTMHATATATAAATAIAGLADSPAEAAAAVHLPEHLSTVPAGTSPTGAPRPHGPLLPLDPVLPQLATALDALAMAAVWARALPPGTRLEACAVERIKYRPRRNLSVSYRLQLRCGTRQFEQPVAARFTSPADALRRLQTARARGGPVGPVGLSVSHDPALHLVAHWWPHDPKLPAAALLADPVALAARCAPVLAAPLAAAGWQGIVGSPVRHAEVQLAQLVPEQRVAARVALHWPLSRVDLIAKASADGRGGVTQAVMAALWQSPARHAGQLRMPRPLLWQPELGLHWQCAVPGEALLDRLDRAEAAGDRPALHRLQAQAGALLAALHGTPVPAERRVNAHDLVERLALLRETLLLIAPAWHARFAPLLDRLAEDLPPGLQQQPRVTLHGDLHPRNLLCERDQLCLIDFDSVRHGPAVLDLGSWCADSLFRRLLAGRPAAEAGAGLAAFLQAYQSAARAAGLVPPDDALLVRVTAWQLACERAWRCLVNLKPGRFARVPDVLALAEALWQSGRLPEPAAHTEATTMTILNAPDGPVPPTTAMASLAAMAPTDPAVPSPRQGGEGRR